MGEENVYHYVMSQVLPPPLVITLDGQLVDCLPPVGQ